MRRNGEISFQDIYKRSSVHDQKLITECRESNDVIGLLCQNNKEFSSLLKELPFFLHALFHHHILQDFSKAKKLYKEALKRTEFTRGCYNMLVSIYLVESQYSNGQTDLKLLEKKLLSLEEKFGHFLRYELSLLKMRDKLMQTMREQ